MGSSEVERVGAGRGRKCAIYATTHGIDYLLLLIPREKRGNELNHLTVVAAVVAAAEAKAACGGLASAGAA